MNVVNDSELYTESGEDGKFYVTYILPQEQQKNLNTSMVPLPKE